MIYPMKRICPANKRPVDRLNAIVPSLVTELEEQLDAKNLYVRKSLEIDVVIQRDLKLRHAYPRTLID